MQLRSLTRAFSVAAFVAMIVPTTARAQALWDMVHLSGAGGDLGTSEVFSRLCQQWI
jgi:hypothetical protein